MYAKTYSATLYGLQAKTVEVEADSREGLASFNIVGLGDKAVQESKERILAAIRNSGYNITLQKLTINLAPANLPKSGPNSDLAVAMAILKCTNSIQYGPSIAFLAELDSQGNLKPLQGVINLVDCLVENGIQNIVVSRENLLEAQLISKANVIAVKSLKDCVKASQQQWHSADRPNLRETKPPVFPVDIANIKGNNLGKRALEIAATGGHHLLLEGIPGSGKSLLARALPSLLPQLSSTDCLEVTKIHSAVGLLDPLNPLLTTRPFRAPHHTITQTALIGGGNQPYPGEITLAHKGVLFLDELAEFSTNLLDNLRQPLESKHIHLARSKYSVTFPANILLVAAMNPCKCGYYGSNVKSCICTPSQVISYHQKISGPLNDRLDLKVKVNKIDYSALFSDQSLETSNEVRKRIEVAQEFIEYEYKNIRGKKLADLTPQELAEINLPKQPITYLQQSAKTLSLSARAYYSTLRVALSISALSKNQLSKSHISEALVYRKS